MSPATDSFTQVEPSMFPGGALVVTLEALLDPLEQTVLFVVSARDVSAQKLRHLWSTAPRGWDMLEAPMAEAVGELRRVVRENSGPFT